MTDRLEGLTAAREIYNKWAATMGGDSYPELLDRAIADARQSEDWAGWGGVPRIEMSDGDKDDGDTPTPAIIDAAKAHKEFRARQLASAPPPSPGVSETARVGSGTLISRLQRLANGLDQAADDEDETMGDGTEDADQMRGHAALINEAIAAIRASAGTFDEGVEAAAKMDTEANAFAMELVMPTKFLIKEIRAMGGVSIDDDEKMDRLARKFKVQRQILAVRLLKLNDELMRGEHV